jgi:hypothetical protein
VLRCRKLRVTALPAYALLCAVLCTLMCAAPYALAQAPDRGALEGTVLDQQGHAVAGAQLQLKNEADGAEATATADAQGLFHFSGLAPGTYRLNASERSFAGWQAEAVVSVGSVTTVHAALLPGLRQEVVHVGALAPLLDISSPAVTTSLDATAVHNLPSSSRKWSDFALLTPGVTPDASADGLLSFRGIGALLNNNTVDGADNNQAFFAQERGTTTVAYSNPESAVEEFQVNTSNYGAEYGRAAGGVINTVTRSGGNAVHGDAFFYDRNGAWAATNAQTTQTELTVGANNTAVTLPARLQNTLTQAGATVGGPLKHDKLFGIVTYDRYHRIFPGIARAGNAAKLFATPTQQSIQTLASRLSVLPAQAEQEYDGVLTGVASLLGNVARTADQTIYLPRLDWQAGDRDHFTVQWNDLRWNSPNGVLSGATETYGVNSFGNSAVKDDTVIARWAHFLSPNVLNELVFQYARDLESETSDAPSPFEAALARNIYGRAPGVRIEDYGFEFGTPPVLDRAAYPDERRYEAQESLTYVHGRQTFQMGYSFDFVNDYSDSLYNAYGTYVYANILDFATDYLSSNHCDDATTGVGTLPCYAYYEQGFGPTTFQFQSSDYAGFFSDIWKARSGLTLSLGLRYEYEQLPNTNASLVNPDLPQTGHLPHDKNNFGPRVGLAWDVTGSGHTVVQAGYGVYYGRIINSTALSALSGTGTAQAQRAYYFTPLATGTPPFPYVFSSTPYLSVAPSAVYFDPRFQNPQVEQAELSLEQKLGRSSSLTFTGMYSAGRELPNYIDSNIDLSSAQTLTYRVVDPLHEGPLPATYTTRFYTARLNPNYGQLTRIFSETNSKYAAGVVRFKHNVTRSLDMLASFTYAHAADWNQNATAFADVDDVLDPANLALEYGDSDADIRRRVTGGMVLRTPWQVKGLLGRLADGYEASATGELRDGLPYSMATTGSVPALRVEDDLHRINILSGLGASINGSGGAKRLAEVGRNTFRYPAVANANLRISKRTAVGHGVTLELLGESFDLLNHANVTAIDTTGYTSQNSSTAGGDPTLTWQSGTTADSSEFGTILSTNNTSLYQDREFQLSARLHF